MHLIIMDTWLAKTQPIYLSGRRLLVVACVALLSLMLVTAGLYYGLFSLGARNGWPLVSFMSQLVGKDEQAQRDRFMRENVDLMARRLGEMQARLMQLEALGERVSGLAGISQSPSKLPGSGGTLVTGPELTLQNLEHTLADLNRLTGQQVDLMTVMESRLFDQKIKKMMIPTQMPVREGFTGSAFGWRIDPITARMALHTGLDFPAYPGTPILAAAGGVVVGQAYHAAYGNMLEVDHGNDLVTRYGHASRVWVKKGDVVKRGQKIAEVGSTGRSTGPHLHFEVLVQSVFQDPQKFLDAGLNLQTAALAKAPGKSPPGPSAQAQRSNAGILQR